MYKIKLLTLEQMKKIYESQMSKDFPAEELRPFDSMEEMMQKGIYVPLGYLDDADNLISYAFFLKAIKTKAVLLDFYAVASSQRGLGIGGSFISRFKEYFHSTAVDHVLFEVEAVQTATDPADLLIRERRIHFYEKNGCYLTEVRSKLLGVDYNIMYLSFHGELISEEQLMGELDRMYHLIVMPLIDNDEDYFENAKIWVE